VLTAILAISLLVAFSLFAIPSIRASPTNIEVNETGWWWEGQPGTFNASSTPIQHAINNASAGDTIFVHAGNYTPPSTIIINKDNLTLKGPQADVDPRPSCGSTRTPGSVAEAVTNGSAHNLGRIILIDADNVTINGLEIKSGTGDMIRQRNTYNGTIVKYCIVHDGRGDEGIQLKQCTDGLLEYNYVYDIASPGDALNIADGSSNGKIRYNEAHDIGSSYAAIYVYGSTDMEIADNRVYTVPNGGGIRVMEDGGGSGALIRDNVIHDVEKSGLFVDINDVSIEGNEIHNSRNTGILIKNVVDATTVTINNNSIFNNSPCGVTNENNSLLDATNNWWGDVSGPSGVGYGTGDAVSGNVNYDPWLDAPYPGGLPINFTDAAIETAPAGTTEIDAKTVADTTVSINTTAPVNVTIAEYSRNPGTGFVGDIGKYIEVHLNDTTNATNMTIKLFYTDADIVDLNDNTLRMLWWNATIGDWVACSNTGVNTTDQNGYRGYIWAIINNTTIPSFKDLTGTPFGGMGEAPPIPERVPVLTPIGMLALICILSVVLAVATLRKRE